MSSKSASSGNTSLVALVAQDGAQVVARQLEPGFEGRFVSRPADLPAQLSAALDETGIRRLYAHQREAMDAIARGEHVVLTTGTASGKSLAYQLPALTRLIEDPAATVLALYPTKALAHDQLRELARLGSHAGVPVEWLSSYDGDTPNDRRAGIRAEARFLITNPDMLHAAVLPHHTIWRRFLAGLSLVIVDEVHAYRGVFGGHVAGVLRRLTRIARHYGAKPTFVMTSATIANPAEHAGKLIGAELRHIASDGAPRPERELLLVQPPLVDRELGLRRPALREAVSITARLIASGRQVLVFAGSRQGVEEGVLALRSIAPEVRSYRSGLLPFERRAIEEELRSGDARAVVATNALELGIDVGSVDAVVIAGYPGSNASFRQQLGRAGRRDRAGSGILVLGNGPLDQYLATHPRHLFGQTMERALTNPDHLLIALDHLRCAAFELPLESRESFGGYGPEAVSLLLRELRRSGEVHIAQGRAYWVGGTSPALEVSLRSTGNDRVALQWDGRTIGTVDAPSARWLAHEGAVYLHDGDAFLVESLDIAERVAHLTPTATGYLTRATRDSRIEPAGELRQEMVRGAVKFEGDVVVTETVTGYRRIRLGTFETLGRYPLTSEPTTLFTSAYGFSPTESTIAVLEEMGAWSNDANDYGPNWPAIRAAVKSRDGRRCQACGASEQNGVVLHVHHKVPFRSFAHRSQANELTNLVSLCPSCHRRAEQSVKIRSSLAAVAQLLRSLAPLLVMCDGRDLGVNSDPASRLVDGRPAVVIYETVPGGVGLAYELAQRHEELLAAARVLIARCQCEEGCPSCVGPAGEQGHAGKLEAAALLEALT